MPNGHDGRMQARRRAQARAAARRRTRRTRLIALLLVLLPCALLLAATVSASASSSPAERQARAEVKAAEHLARHEAKEAAIQARREAAQLVRKERQEVNHPNGGAVFSCTQVTWTFRAFPDAAGNTVQQQVTIERDHATAKHSTFVFAGPTATTTTPLDGHPGRYQVDAWAIWKTNGLTGHFDFRGHVTCPSTPALSIEKLQRLGSTTPYTPSTLIGEVGQTVEYEIVVKNTGNIPLTLSALNDPRCDAGTIAGGPGGGTLAIGESSTFTCTHLLSAADQTAGSYANTAGDTATPVGEGSPVTGSSNTVVVDVPGGEGPSGGVLPEKTEEKPAGKTTSTTNDSPTSGVLALTASPTGSTGVTGTLPKIGVLASKTTAIPSLNGPHGCVRAGASVSMRSAGVRSVSFYMDGHRLKTMTARSARRGRLTMPIDLSKLSVGSHRLLAKITMVPTSSTAKPRHATRTATVLRCRSAVLTPRFTG